jgi:hypothetical protein
MIDDDVVARGNRLVFEGTSERVLTEIERRLRKRYTRGLFVQGVTESADGDLLLQLGVAYPKDVSDSRHRDRVMKFINVGEVETLRAKRTGKSHYAVDLPERAELYDAFEDRRREALGRLDWSTAKAIFEDVYQLNPVRNQLNSVVEIIKFLQRESPLDIDRLDNIQGQANTRAYLRVLDDFDFVRLDEGAVYQGRKMEQADAASVPYEEYEKTIVGQIVSDAYYVLREELDLRMLSHFPKYANAYYFSAVQKSDPNLWLDTEAIQRNLSAEWNDDVDPLVVEEKIEQLSEVDVVVREDGFVTANESVFEQISSAASGMALAD